jgi:hypothetical protein
VPSGLGGPVGDVISTSLATYVISTSARPTQRPRSSELSCRVSALGFSVKLRLKPCFSDLLDRVLIAGSALHDGQPPACRD